MENKTVWTGYIPEKDYGCGWITRDGGCLWLVSKVNGSPGQKVPPNQMIYVTRPAPEFHGGPGEWIEVCYNGRFWFVEQQVLMFRAMPMP